MSVARPTQHRADLIRVARDLQAQGLRQQRIAERLGISASYVSELLNDPDRVRARRNRARHARSCPTCGIAISFDSQTCQQHRVRPRMTDAERLAKHSQPAADGCIEWTGRITSDGYGHCRAFVDGKWTFRGAHRLAYIAAKGPIPDGLHVHHLCYNRRCINPAHLELRTPRDNVLDADSRSLALAAARQTHCVHGHPFDAENTYVRPTGERLCRECSRRNSRATARRKAHRKRLAQSLAASGVSQ